MLFESKLEQATVNSTYKIVPMTQDDQDVSAGVIYDNYIKMAGAVGANADVPGASFATTDFGKFFLVNA